MIEGMDDPDRGGGRVIRVSAVVLVRPDGAVVTVRKHGTDRFMLPGGKPEPGESPLGCAVREVREELGVAVDPGSLRPLGRFETATANEPGFRLVSEVFVAACDGPAAPAAEIAESRWLAATELDALARFDEDDCAPWAPLLVRVAREHPESCRGGVRPPGSR